MAAHQGRPKELDEGMRLATGHAAHAHEVDVEAAGEADRQRGHGGNLEGNSGASATGILRCNSLAIGGNAQAGGARAAVHGRHGARCDAVLGRAQSDLHEGEEPT